MLIFIFIHGGESVCTRDESATVACTLAYDAIYRQAVVFRCHPSCLLLRHQETLRDSKPAMTHLNSLLLISITLLPRTGFEHPRIRTPAMIRMLTPLHSSPTKQTAISSAPATPRQLSFTVTCEYTNIVDKTFCQQRCRRCASTAGRWRRKNRPIRRIGYRARTRPALINAPMADLDRANHSMVGWIGCPAGQWSLTQGR